jgi:hypothetical protein
MSDAFQDRENNFEKQFVKDEALRFKATARRNRALGLWIAELKGISGEAAGKYAEDFVGGHIGRSDDEIAAVVRDDLARANVDLSDHRLRKKMADEMSIALASVKAGK